MTQEECQALWQKRIAEFKESGKSVTVWCAENDVKANQLWYWLRKEKQGSKKEISWLPLGLSCEATRPSLLVRVGQATVEVSPGFDRKLLLEVVETLNAQ